MTPKAIVILSGGMDSAVCLYQARKAGYQTYALSFNYGQRHGKELECAKRLGQLAGVAEHRFLDLPRPTNNVLSDDGILPARRSLNDMVSQIPATYVPARNTLFIAFALQMAEEIDADKIYVGITGMDYSGYPDCRPEYILAWQNLINLATKKTTQDKGKIQLEAPLQFLYKPEIVKLGESLGVPFEHTWTCYAGGDQPCLRCDSCLLRKKGFDDAGETDPITKGSLGAN
jgi:7-cyano-7-deazaguanine synthase